MATSKDFNPFLCTPRRTDTVDVTGMGKSEVLLCQAGDETLLVYVKDTASVISLGTCRPHENKLIATLQWSPLAMTYLPKGLLAFTTGTTSLIFLDVTKTPADVKREITEDAYGAATRGLEDTVIASPENAPSRLDIIASDGRVIRRLNISHCAISRRLFRSRDYVIACYKGQPLLKIGLETGETSTLSHEDVVEPKELFVDDRDRLYIADTRGKIHVTDLRGNWRELDVCSSGGFVVSTDEGKVFTTDKCCDSQLLVYDLTKY